MKRRQILSSVGAVGAIGGIGYLWARGGGGVSTPEAVTDLSFETDRPPEGWYVDTDEPGPADDPVISTGGADGSVEVTGTIWIGSRDCKRSIVDDVAFDTRTNRLRVTIGHDEQSRTLRERIDGRVCRDALGSEQYTLSLRVDASVRTIEAIERDSTGNSRSAEASLSDQQ